MKAEELMIGDWVIFLGKYRKVCQIGPDNQVRFYGENKVIVSADELDPIPLTPEILEKNGFKNYGESWYLPDDNVKVMVGFYMYKTTIHVKKGDDIFQKEVRCSYSACAENRGVHVHTLQHALRLCRIEKEVTL